MSDDSSSPTAAPSTTYQIWYWRPQYIFEALDGQLVIDPNCLERTHVHLLDLEAIPSPQALERIYGRMQGESWSPNGEAKTLLKRLELDHTSMAPSDVIVDPKGLIHRVAGVGFKLIEA